MIGDILEITYIRNKIRAWLIKFETGEVCGLKVSLMKTVGILRNRYYAGSLSRHTA